MAVIQDLVLTFCPTMHSVQQKKLKLLMPLYNGYKSAVACLIKSSVTLLPNLALK